MCTCSIGSLPNVDADVIKNLNMMEPGTGLGIVDHMAGMQGGRGAVRRLSSSMGPNVDSIAEESILEASLSDGQVSNLHNLQNLLDVRNEGGRGYLQKQT